MLKKLTIIFMFTGTAHLLSVFVLKWMAKETQLEQMAMIGEFESLLQLIIGLVGFGMQSAAIRSISLTENWKQKLDEAQTARTTFGVLLAAASVLFFVKNIYSSFLLAPLIATSADYALYARGKAVAGAFVAFVRVAFPLLVSMATVIFWPDYLWQVYVMATIVVYFITNATTSIFLDSRFFYWPSLRSLQLYLSTIPLGILNLTFYFMGLGILLIAPFFLDDSELVISFLALKFYVVYKGVLRVVHQALINQMISEKIGYHVDQLGMMLSLILLASVLIFPNVFISDFFGAQYISQSPYFLWIALAAVSFSIFNSLATRLVLQHKEILFTKISLASSGLLVISLFLFSYLGFSSKAIPLSLFIGETALTISLAFWFLDRKAVRDRLLFFLYCSTSMAIPITIKFFFGENNNSYFISFAIMGLTLLFFTHKNFSVPSSVSLDSKKYGEDAQ